MVRINVEGTTAPNFQVGVSGPTFHQGLGNPLNSFGIDGDFFCRTDSPQRIFQKVDGFWLDLHAYSWSLIGAVQNVGTNALNSLNHGAGSTNTGVVMYHRGVILGISINLSAPRSAGALQAAAWLNGVAVTGPGRVLTIDAANPQKAFTEFPGPQLYQPGDVVTGATQTTGFNPSSVDVTMAIFCRDFF